MRSVPSNRAKGSAILLVDDNRDGSDARCSVLEQLGFLVSYAGSGEDALQMIAGKTFDLVITDLVMEPMDGKQLIATLRQCGFKNPVILLTGFANMLGLKPENTGADAVVNKSAKEIDEIVRQAKRLLNPAKKPAGSLVARKQKSRSSA
ncbi:MAG: response regulator [Acidobacteriaceae bacterium]|nr:response regulator [Acidobacteriaceae bacterium]MBV9501735.1 response regulator [Acidobacteriaceae bacterium]